MKELVFFSYNTNIHKQHLPLLELVIDFRQLLFAFSRSIFKKSVWKLDYSKLVYPAQTGTQVIQIRSNKIL